MGKKAAQKRAYILQQAEAVFAQMGFGQVTMQNIVQACGISRGGVYLYFPDTRQLFEAVLQMRADREQALAAAHQADTGSARAQMLQFLQAQRLELLHPADSLILATYEYLFAQRAALHPEVMARRFQDATDQLAALIEHGVAQGEFAVEPEAAAANLVLTLEGLRISSTVLPFDAAFLDRQMGHILSQLEGDCHVSKQ